MTEALTILEGIERGPAGNTSLAAAFSLAQELKQDQIIIVQETEYTGAGKHHFAQLDFAKSNGIKVSFGDPKTEIPGISIVLPNNLKLIKVVDQDLDKMRKSLIKNLIKDHKYLTKNDILFLSKETNKDKDFVQKYLKEINISWED